MYDLSRDQNSTQTRFSPWQESDQRDMVWEGMGLAQETVSGSMVPVFFSPLDIVPMVSAFVRETQHGKFTLFTIYALVAHVGVPCSGIDCASFFQKHYAFLLIQFSRSKKHERLITVRGYVSEHQGVKLTCSTIEVDSFSPNPFNGDF
jgi:hypothetical protein